MILCKITYNRLSFIYVLNNTHYSVFVKKSFFVFFFSLELLKLPSNLICPFYILFFGQFMIIEPIIFTKQTEMTKLNMKIKDKNEMNITFKSVSNSIENR